MNLGLFSPDWKVRVRKASEHKPKTTSLTAYTWAIAYTVIYELQHGFSCSVSTYTA